MAGRYVHLICRHHLMCRAILCMASLSIVFAIHAADAAPTARELKSLGSGVAMPTRRPAVEENTAKQKPVSRKPAAASEPQAERQKSIKQNSLCIARLRAIAVADATETPEADDPACIIADPVVLKATKGNTPIRFPEGLVLSCDFAATLAEFTSSVAQPLALHHMGKSIDTILSGQGFVCRRRNNAADGKLSEHATGNATDWIGFKFKDGSQLNIRATGGLKPAEREFLNAVRTSACGYFTTVLGPGSNAAHATHFHFDLGRTSPERKNPYRICE